MRQAQVSIHHAAHRGDSLKKALAVMCHQRTRLRGVRGDSLVQRVLGTALRGDLGAADDGVDKHMLAQEDPRGEIQEKLQRRADAGRAILQANMNRAVRTAAAARNLLVRKESSMGDWVYHWRLKECYW